MHRLVLFSIVTETSFVAHFSVESFLPRPCVLFCRLPFVFFALVFKWSTPTVHETFLVKLRQDPLEAILVIFGCRALIFFVWKLLKKNEKWHHFCAHAQWWSPWRRKNVEKGHLAPSNLTFLLIALDENGFRRMKEEGQIYKTLPKIFNFCQGT